MPLPSLAVDERDAIHDEHKVANGIKFRKYMFRDFKVVLLARANAIAVHPVSVSTLSLM
jgi:hypothetical protein